MNYFIKTKSGVSGPFSEAELLERVNGRIVSALDEVSVDGKTWRRVGTLALYRRSPLQGPPAAETGEACREGNGRRAALQAPMRQPAPSQTPGPVRGKSASSWRAVALCAIVAVLVLGMVVCSLRIARRGAGQGAAPSQPAVSVPRRFASLSAFRYEVAHDPALFEKCPASFQRDAETRFLIAAGKVAYPLLSEFFAYAFVGGMSQIDGGVRAIFYNPWWDIAACADFRREETELSPVAIGFVPGPSFYTPANGTGKAMAPLAVQLCVNSSKAIAVAEKPFFDEAAAKIAVQCKILERMAFVQAVKELLPEFGERLSALLKVLRDDAPPPESGRLAKVCAALSELPPEARKGFRLVHVMRRGDGIDVAFSNGDTPTIAVAAFIPDDASAQTEALAWNFVQADELVDNWKKGEKK